MMRKARRIWLKVLAVVPLGVLAVGWGYYLVRPTSIDVVPGEGLQITDEELAQTIEKARGQVLDSPRSAEAWGYLGMILLAHDYLRQAESCFAEANRWAPRDAKWLYYRFLTLRDRQPERALEALRGAVDLGGDSLESAQHQLAELLLDLNRLSEAEQYFLALLRRNPEDLRACYGMGRLAFEQHDWKSSRYFLERSVRSPCAARASSTMLAQIYRLQGESDRAEGEIKKLMTLPQDRPWPDSQREALDELLVGRLNRLDRAADFLRSQRYREAERLLLQLARDYSQCDRTWPMLTRLYVDTNRLLEAEHAARQAQRRAPASAEVHFLVGLVLRRRGNLNAAESELQQAIKLNPTDALAYFELGECRRQRGNLQAAVEAYRQAVICRPQFLVAHVHLAEVLIETGQVRAAMQPLKDVLLLEPGHDSASRLLCQFLPRGLGPIPF